MLTVYFIFIFYYYFNICQRNSIFHFVYSPRCRCLLSRLSPAPCASSLRLRAAGDGISGARLYSVRGRMWCAAAVRAGAARASLRRRGCHAEKGGCLLTVMHLGPTNVRGAFSLGGNR